MHCCKRFSFCSAWFGQFSWFRLIFADLLGNRSLLQWVIKVMWFVIGGFWSSLCVSVFQGSLLLNFRVLALKFFFVLLLKQGKFRLPRWNCSYSASKSWRNSDIGGWKQSGTFPPTFNNCSFCLLLPQYLTSHDWILWWWLNLTSKKNLKLWNIFKNAGCLLFKGAVIQLYKKRSFESYRFFISILFFVVSFTSGNSMWFSSSNWQVNERTEGCVQIWQFQKR